MAGFSERGFERKQYTDIEKDLFVRAKSFFGEDINLTERSPVGIFLRIMAWSIASLWQVAERIYTQGHLPDAEGIGLDYVAEKANIYRFPALKSYGKVNFTGAKGKKIPKGFKVSTKNGILFETLEDCIIGETGSVETTVICLENGEVGNVKPAEINTIFNPELEIDKVENISGFANGRDVEKDEELRERYKISFVGSGKATIDAVRAELLKIPTVKGVVVKQNNSMEEKGGMPPKSIKAIVLGGTDEEVAKAILSTKAAGIEACGSITVIVSDNIGELHDIKFSRATEIPIYVKVIVKGEANERITEEIKSRVIKHINEIGMGKPVVVSKIVSLSFLLELEDIEVMVGRSETLQKENLQMSDEEVPWSDEDKVVIAYEP